MPLLVDIMLGFAVSILMIMLLMTILSNCVLRFIVLDHLPEQEHEMECLPKYSPKLPDYSEHVTLDEIINI